MNKTERLAERTTMNRFRYLHENYADAIARTLAVAFVSTHGYPADGADYMVEQLCAALRCARRLGHPDCFPFLGGAQFPEFIDGCERVDVEDFASVVTEAHAYLEGEA